MVKKLSISVICLIVLLLCAWHVRVHAAIYRINRNAVKSDTTKKADESNISSGDDDNDDSDGDDDSLSVSTVLLCGDRYAIFDKTARYTFEVKNPTDSVEDGTVSYQAYTERDKPLNSDVVKVHIPPKSSHKYDFEIPEADAGFYKVQFRVNVSDYDDTTRRAFGIRPEEIRSPYEKPADFNEFWENTRAELEKVPPHFKMTLLPDSTKDNRNVYLVEMQSLDNLTIRGYLTVPITHSKHKKFAVLLGLPGYQVALHAMFGTDPDLAIMTLNVRGQGNSRDVIHTRRDDYIFYHIGDKNKYVLRGAIMDCIRAIDFIYSQPDLDHDKIMVSGGSMGGFLSIATASIDKRVALCSAQNPIMSDVRDLPGEVDWPLNDIYQYIAIRPGLTFAKVLDNLDYFDTKNFATNLTCPTLLGIGLLDPLVPPNNAYVDYNNMKVKKHIIIFRDLGHEVGAEYKVYEGRWMRDAFGLF